MLLDSRLCLPQNYFLLFNFISRATNTCDFKVLIVGLRKYETFLTILYLPLAYSIEKQDELGNYITKVLHSLLLERSNQALILSRDFKKLTLVYYLHCPPIST